MPLEFRKPQPAQRGRKPTTGRYATREELVEAVWGFYDMPNTSIAQVARICRVSEGVVAKVLDAPRPASPSARLNRAHSVNSMADAEGHGHSQELRYEDQDR